MANSELYNKEFKVPDEILNKIKAILVSHPQGNGVKRAKFIVNNGSITYQSMKRLKNYFDNYNSQKDDNIQYELSGGLEMKQFIDVTLTQNRDAIERSKKHKADIHANPNSELKPYRSPRLTEGEEELKQNAVAVIINENKEVLLLKRSSYPAQWMPNKWALIGGEIEEGETAKEACIREVYEETELYVGVYSIKDSFTIQRHKDSVEHIFVCVFNGNDDDVKINDESADYGWFKLNEIESLDKVPHLIEYIVLAVKKYD